jgi:hypothetical protein
MRYVALILAAVVATGAHPASPGQPGDDKAPDNSPVLTLAVPGHANATPSIAAAGTRVAVAWSAREPGGKTDVLVATSADGGRTFGAPVRVNADRGTARVGGEMPPRVAFSGYGIDVLWTSRNDAGTTIRIARSEDGRTFGPSRELQQAGAPGDRGWPAVAADATGAVHAIWLDHRGLAAEGSAKHVHGAARSTAEKHDGVAMAQKSALFYSGGAGEQPIATGVCYCCKTAVASAPGGTVFAAWRHVFAGNIRDIAFTVSRDGGRSFAPLVRVSEDRWQLDGCPDDGPSMAVDEARVVHVAWPSVVDRPEPHKAIFYTWTEDGRSFQPRARVTPIGRNAAHPHIVAHRAGVTVLWDELIAGTRQVFAARRSRSNSNFAAVALSDGHGAASYPVAVIAGDAIVAAWVKGGGEDSAVVVRRIAIR